MLLYVKITMPWKKKLIRTYCCSESWLSSCVVDAQIWLPMFHLYRHDRKRRHDGGVLLFVRNTLTSRIVACSSNQMDGFPEFMIAEVWSSIRNKVLISVIYRPPNTALLDIFKQDFDELFMHYKNIVVTGHDCISVTLNYSVPKHTKMIIRRRNWDLINDESIANNINDFVTSNFAEYLSIVDFVSGMNHSMHSVVDSIAPAHMIRVKI
ncbi:hypothetical protein M0804_015546 [Polistes exclamans]|nr:hypothetical protein M0804_015546 [Polistes exclamans]